MELTCIVCPNGCNLIAEIADDGSITVSGNKCKRGIDFATRELTEPTRTVCTTVRTNSYNVPTVSVRTSGEIPKDKIFEVIKAAQNVTVTAKLKIGDAVVKNLFGLNVDLIATSAFDPND